MKNILTHLKKRKWLIFIILFVIILIVISFIIFNNKDIEVTEDDLINGINKTYKNASDVSCDFYTNVKYGTKYYSKYYCNFKYKINEDDEEKETNSCVDCEVNDEGKLVCNIGSSKCFK